MEGNLENIKSKYVLRKVADNLSQNQLLKLINYNKNIQEKLEIGINTYKKVYNQTIIEIIPCEKFIYGPFINFPVENEKYFHIYFNNEKNERKNQMISEDDNIEKIKIIIDEEVNSFNGLFRCAHTIKKINFHKFNRTDIIDMNSMFFGCIHMQELNNPNFHTNSVTDMSQMFSVCSRLKKINVQNFITNNVTNMSHMFNKCSQIKKLNLIQKNSHFYGRRFFTFFDKFEFIQINLPPIIEFK